MKSKFPFKCITKYIPSRYDNLKDWQIDNQRLVYDFKNGKIREEHKKLFLDAVKTIIADDPDSWVVCFIPASTRERTEQRYAGLCEYLTENLECQVYLHSIQNFHDYEPVHQNGVTEYKLHSFHREHFAGKNVILIDDVITTGRSFREMGDKLLYIGALSIYGVCFAMTIHPHLPRKNRKNYI